MLTQDILDIKDGRIITSDGGVGSGIKGHTTAEENNQERGMQYFTVVRKPYTYPLQLKRPNATKEEVLKEFPDAKFIDSTTDSSPDLDFQGIKIHVENDKGEFRKGIGEDGEEYKTKMFYPYGEITECDGQEIIPGVDGDPVDVFVGPDKNAENVFIIHQKVDGKYDEDKVFLGFPSMLNVRDAFCAHYDRPEEFLGPITRMRMEDFKKFLKDNKVAKKIA